MQPSLNTWAVLLLFAAAQGVFLALILFTHRRGNRRANRVLALLILLLALRLLETVGYWTKYLYEFPHFWLSTASFSFLFGPLLYFYAKLLSTEPLKIDRKQALHFLPFLLYLAWLVPFYSLPREVKLGILARYLAVENPTLPWRYFALFFVQISHMLFYTGLTLGLLQVRTQNLKSNNATLERISLQWLRRMTLGFGVCVLLMLVYMTALQLGLPYSRAIDALVLLALALLLYAISYVALRQPEIFSGALAVKNAPKYEKSSLSTDRAAAHLAKLQQTMSTEKLFLNNDLKLQDLADRLEVPPHHLSQILNAHLGQNFFDFLNHYRVAEAQKTSRRPRQTALHHIKPGIGSGFQQQSLL